MERFNIGGHDVIVSYEQLPHGWKGWTSPRQWGYIVLIDARLDPRGAFRQLLDEVRKIRGYEDCTDQYKRELAKRTDQELGRPQLLLNIEERIWRAYRLD